MLKPEDDFNPLKMLKEIKEADPEYRRNIASLLELRNRPMNESALALA